ncbi:solute carrier family 22 member 13-like isoform X3 [Nothoprocta perdicaria]|uniref:solute carrier family 22 member 13-like isoform X3 n=1 Tax=Nothoprocta perdicaria TaxID=30464 RepID=UPI000E1B623C|nr:solute carrier family 22 member 13-like isoform X3 [Nothoprocta perdicaria]
MSGTGELLKAAGGFGPFQKWLMVLSSLPCFSLSFHQFCQLFMVPDVPHHCDTSWIRAVGPNLTEDELLNLTVPRGASGAYEQCSMYSPVDRDLDSIVAYGLNATQKCSNGWVYPAHHEETLVTQNRSSACYSNLHAHPGLIWCWNCLCAPFLRVHGLQVCRGGFHVGDHHDNIGFSYGMGWCLLPAPRSACFSLLFCHRTDDFGWLELRYPQLETVTDCRICTYICPFLLLLLKPEVQTKPGSTMDLFRKKHLCKVTLIMLCAWFANSLAYYGISLNVTNFGLDIYLTQLAFGAVEIPARASCILLLQWFGRKKCQGFLLLLSGLVCLIITGIPEDLPVVITVLAIIGKFATSASFSTSYVYTAELFPTVVRQTGVGLCSMSARVAGIIAPLIRLLARYHHSVPMAIFGSVPVLAGLLCFLLHETRGMDLVDDTSAAAPQHRSCENANRSSENGHVKAKGGDLDKEHAESTYF